MSLTDELAADENTRRLERENDALRRALRSAQRKLGEKEDKAAAYGDRIYEAARDAALAVGTPGPIPRPKRDRRRSPEAALLHLTDWQLGKKQSASYDMDVCEARVQTVARKTAKLADIMRADHPVRECHVMLGGDLVENTGIFPGQAYEIQAGAYEQVFRAAALVQQTVESLLGEFEAVTVWEVYGNHGRIGRKGDSPREDNLDAFVCRIARERLAKQERLTWHVPPSWYSIVAVGEYRALLVHGDQIRSFGGNVPAYGVLRKSTAWKAGGIPERFTDVYLGHMHQPMTLQMPHGGMVYMTPSTESGSAYASEFVGALGRPGQRLMFIDPRRGRVTAEYLIWLDDD